MPKLRTLAKVALPLAVLAAAGGGAGYLQATRPEVEPEPRVDRVWAVSTVPVELGTHSPTIELFGQLVASRRAVLQSPIEGRVAAVEDGLVEGGTVAAGEPLLHIDTFDEDAREREVQAGLEQQEAKLAELRVGLDAERDMVELGEERLALARRDLDRQEKLQSSSFASKKSLDDARMRLAAEKTSLRQHQREYSALGARIRQQDAAITEREITLERIRRDIEDAVVTAPFDAFVGSVDVAMGKELKRHDRIATLVDRTSIEMRFTIDDIDFGRLWTDGLLGRPVRALWSLGERGFELEGEVVRIESELDPKRGGVQVYAEVTGNPDNAPLRPGAFLQIEIEDRAHEAVAELPRSALFEPGKLYGVVDERLVELEVSVVDRNAERVLVRGGLEDGMEIVTTRLAEIGPGLRVEVVPRTAE